MALPCGRLLKRLQAPGYLLANCGSSTSFRQTTDGSLGWIISFADSCKNRTGLNSPYLMTFPKHLHFLQGFTIILLVIGDSSMRATNWPSPPPQHQGKPYTRSSLEFAKPLISPYIVVHRLSRYAWVYGQKTRIDNHDILRGEPIIRADDLFVPIEFTGVFDLRPPLAPSPAPTYLKDRWVHDLDLEPNSGVKDAHFINHNSRKLVGLKSASLQAGFTVHEQGDLWFIALSGSNPPRLSPIEHDNLVTLFDTPEKYADPSLASHYIPLLKRQGQWTDHAAITDRDLALLDGPEPVWQTTPQSDHDLTGFAAERLGSPPPPPGEYPRILFSEADLPTIRDHIQANVIARRTWVELEVLFRTTWLDPQSEDGRVFEKLASGDIDDLEWDAWLGGRRIPLFPANFDGQRPGIFSTHVSYNSQCLVALALYAMIADDDELGGKVAAALTNLYQLQEPNLDLFLAFSDSELGSNPGDANASTTQWRGVHTAIAHMDLPFALDFAGRWMSEAQKQTMHRIIAKATYGRRTNGGDGPRRNWRDTNHVSWHLTHLLSLMAIEGQEGFDPEAYASGSELVRDFLQWGVNASGTIYESNGKSGAGLQFQTLAMIGLARRGENYWGHPHWRRILQSQVLNTAPNGKTTVSSGTWSGGLISVPFTMLYHTFYPEDPHADYLLGIASPPEITPGSLGHMKLESFNLDAYRRELESDIGRTRLPSLNYVSFTQSLIFDTDWKLTARSALHAPLDFIDRDQGILSSYSDRTEQAVWLHIQVRNNHYLGAGHHHADAGMFHFAADGVNWITESPFKKIYDGRYHNQVLIDGIAQPDGVAARADLLELSLQPSGAYIAADLTNAYTWRMSSQFMMFDTDDWGPQPDQYSWTLNQDPLSIAAFKGTQRYKMRPWWATSNFSNWFPNLQRPHNPVEYVYRSAQLIRGDQPYALLVDDAKKDDQTRLYQWSAMPGPGVWAARTDHDLPANKLILAQRGDESMHANAKRIRPQDGEPLLLICLLGGQGTPATFESGLSRASQFALDPYAALAEAAPPDIDAPIRIETRGDGPAWTQSDQVQFFFDQIIGGCHSTAAHFRVLLIPFSAGDSLPSVSYDHAETTAQIRIGAQHDTIKFSTSDAGRTTYTLQRN